MYIRVLDIRVLDDKEKEMLQLIESDEETWKAFKFLVNIVKRNYPWYNNPKREVLKKWYDATYKTWMVSNSSS